MATVNGMTRKDGGEALPSESRVTSAPYNSQKQVMDLRLISYNVHCFPWIPVDIKAIVNWIVRNGDIVALQEVWHRHNEWSAAFAAHGWVFVKPVRETHVASLFGSGLAYAWPQESAKWLLQDALQYPFLDAIGLDSLVTKGWFAIDLIHLETKQTLRLINTHLQADIDLFPSVFKVHTERVRRAQARQMCAHHTTPGKPTLLVGDMNTLNAIFPDYAPFPVEPRIDACFHPKGQAWQLADYEVGPDEWSDHCPIIWNLNFGAAR
jgi:endonuclease/exonuclease/phosphatase family metal-dependent hydrolase